MDALNRPRTPARRSTLAASSRDVSKSARDASEGARDVSESARGLRKSARGMLKAIGFLAVGALLSGGSRPVAADDAPPSPTQAPAGAAPTAPAAGAKPEAASTQKQRFVVAAMGDSLTDARSHGGKFLDYLRERCPQSQFDNYGKGGQMVNQMRKRFAADVLGEPPSPNAPKPAYTHVIIFGGVNDIYSDLTAKRTPKLIERDLLWMYQAAREHGTKVVALTVAPWGGFTKYFNASRSGATLTLNKWIRDQKAAGTVDHVIDTYKLLSCGTPTHLCPDYKLPFKDGLHFGTEGHKKLGEALYTQVFSSCL